MLFDCIAFQMAQATRQPQPIVMKPLRESMLGDANTRRTSDSSQSSVFQMIAQPDKVDSSCSHLTFGGPRVAGVECAALLGMTTTNYRGGSHTIANECGFNLAHS
jgi:hypothetical protein